MVVLPDSWSRFGPPDPDATRYLFRRRSLARTQVLQPLSSLKILGLVGGNPMETVIFPFRDLLGQVTDMGHLET